MWRGHCRHTIPRYKRSKGETFIKTFFNVFNFGCVEYFSLVNLSSKHLELLFSNPKQKSLVPFRIRITLCLLKQLSIKIL